MSPRVNAILRDDPQAILDIDALLRQQRDDICYLQAPSYLIDAGGAPISGGYITIATVDCRVAPGGLSASERVAGGVFAAVGDYEVHFDREVVVESDYRIRHNGTVMEIVGDNRFATDGFELLVSVKVIT